MTTLRLAVVGHTNVGKTSLLRTLARSTRFGTVADAPATTRQAESLSLFESAAGALSLIDTPGLERAGELLERVEAQPQRRADGWAAITAVIDDPAWKPAFEQEARVLREVQTADALIVVIDAREPVLGKYLDELALLAACGRPMVILLNFTAGGTSRERDWREALARLGQHLVVAFDVVLADWPSERQLYERLRVLLPAWTALFDALIAEREQHRDWRRQTGAQRIAVLLLRLAAHEIRVPQGDAAKRAAAIEASKSWAREQEAQLVETLVRLHGHDLGLLQLPELLDADGRWTADLFAAETLLRAGADGLGPIAGGALAGAGIDAAVGGLSFGTGAALGAAGGALVALRNPLKLAWRRHVGGEDTVQIADTVIRALLARNLGLLALLARRGHGAVQPLAAEPAAPDIGGIWSAIRSRLLAARSGGAAMVDDPESAAPKAVAELTAALL
ncbi:DUF3482 domain-containing protein [Nevskia sp.]|uniref:DUF3482 domain-containing protein n=1 Tax=Nevskia sp. TaxID=1929292 RepID=UPI0025E12471|nr:DUF3482 domain-containing protein [Nevskia sp.]